MSASCGNSTRSQPADYGACADPWKRTSSGGTDSGATGPCARRRVNSKARMRFGSVLASSGDRLLAVGGDQVAERREQGRMGEDLRIDAFGERAVPGLAEIGERQPLLLGDRGVSSLAPAASLGVVIVGIVPCRGRAANTVNARKVTRQPCAGAAASSRRG